MFTQQALIDEMEGLRRFAIRLTGNTADAEDLTQSTILRALEKKDYFQEGTNLFKWTSKIMYNMFVSEYRRKTKFETQYDPEDYIQKQAVDSDQEVKAELNSVSEAMQDLSDEHREILVMVCVKGMQYQEVSDLLDIPVGTVRSRLSRARNRLAEILDGHADDEDDLHSLYSNNNGGAPVQMAA